MCNRVAIFTCVVSKYLTFGVELVTVTIVTSQVFCQFS